MAIVQVHIPKTGGSALREGLRSTGAQRWGHSSVLPTEPSGVDQYIVTLRDPVARFRSAYVFQRARLIHRGYPTADSLALALREQSSRFRDLVVFRPQVHWARSAERLRQSDVLAVLRTETLDEDFARLCERMGWEGLELPPRGHRRRNEQFYDEPLTPAAIERVREWYAEDVALIDGLD